MTLPIRTGRVYECRCIRHGLVVFRFAASRPPLQWRVIDEVGAKPRPITFTEATLETVTIERPEATFTRMGMEVDATGTWVRYEVLAEQ